MAESLRSRKGAKARAGDALHASGRAPELLPESDTAPLSQQAFIVSAYPNLEPGVAKGKARALSDYLVGKKLDKARPLEWKGDASPFWVVAVYYDRDAEAATRKLLLGLPPDVPDEAFVHWRNTEAEWPKAVPIR